MWRDFKRPQKSEPSSVLTIRRFVIVSSSIILLGSILALFFKMFKEQPIISTTFSPVDVLPAPVMMETNLSLHKYEDVIGPYFVFLDINIVDPKFPKIINDSAQISSFRMIAFDSNNDYVIQNKSFISPSHQISPFEKSQYYMNKYTLSSGYVQAVPMSSSNKNNITLRVSPSSFIVGEEEEQRHSTVMGIFGTVAAFYSAFLFFYVYLFGVDSIRLWGIVHSGCCGIRIYEEKTKAIIDQDLESIIISDTNSLNSSRGSQASNQDMQIICQDSQSITSRLEELEKFRLFIEMNVIKIKPWIGRANKVNHQKTKIKDMG
ncbi:hypothetical protein F8M41_018792 [Gigaspora margarita]|uniref:Uncharacterized protein n=1 Tax=Gigaspora margarita TaxID=4874 RepID=A0A8H4EL13_GIGMA|nr:hypothetical protein F8M41_018792 [Gigaspora margarita]